MRQGGGVAVTPRPRLAPCQIIGISWLITKLLGSQGVLLPVEG